MFYLKKISYLSLLTFFFIFSSADYSIAKSCSSDFSCGIGNACVKQPFKMTGTCMKTINNYGARNYKSPSSKSIGVKTSG